MNIEYRKGIVKSINSFNGQVYILTLDIEHPIKRAIGYRMLTGDIQKGDSVIANTTAGTLKLGTGGYHFIIYNYSCYEQNISNIGHGMKLKYTPLQFKCLLAEEHDSIYHNDFNLPIDFNHKMIYIGELHSMLAPLCAYLKLFSNNKVKIGYIMTDHGAMPLMFSKSVQELKKKELLDVTITCGNAFGGDYECVNIYTALIAAANIEKCDIIIITMGPGILGTDTKYGFSGLELGFYGNFIMSTGCKKFIYVPRISFADKRARHMGISHHTITILNDIIQSNAKIVLPLMKKSQLSYIYRQLTINKLMEKHNFSIVDGNGIYRALANYEICPTTMGRGIDADPIFFKTVGAAGYYGLFRMLGFKPTI